MGLTALKQLSTDFTIFAEINYQYFFPHTYSFTRYLFGAETRANTAVAYRAYGKRGLRLDLVAELVGLHLKRDRESTDSNGQTALVELQASGGDILYGNLGLRAYVGRFAFGVGMKRAMLKRLNEESEQQGSEGLENFRLAFAFSATTQF